MFELFYYSMEMISIPSFTQWYASFIIRVLQNCSKCGRLLITALFFHLYHQSFLLLKQRFLYDPFENKEVKEYINFYYPFPCNDSSLILTRLYTLETSSDIIFPYINSSSQKEGRQTRVLESHTYTHTYTRPVYHDEICKSMHRNDNWQGWALPLWPVLARPSGHLFPFSQFSRTALNHVGHAKSNKSTFCPS